MPEAPATIDGRPVSPDGLTILDAARSLGIEIPTLCHSPGLSPEGGCRLCLVRDQSITRYIGACHTPLRAGMNIVTDDAELHNLRRTTLELILADHPAGRFTPDPHGNEFQRLLARYDVRVSRFGNRPVPDALDDSHPYIRFDRSACILCRRCLNTCDQVQGQFVFDVAGRGDSARLIFGPTNRLADSDCTACGACVDRCPTAALTDRDRDAASATEPVVTTDSICGYCGVGCRVRITASAGRVRRIDPVPDASVNRGHLCAKGRYAHAYQHHPDRLTQPLIRRGDDFQPVTWQAALDFAAERLADLRDRHGPTSLAALTSSRSTNEAAYLLQKLFRGVIGSNHVDCCARVCHSSTALALQLVTGAGAASASYDDIERARLIVVAGANATEAHPVLGARVKQAVLHGARLIVIDPRRIELADYADLHLPLRPGANVALFNALSRCLIESGRIDRDYIARRLDGFEAFETFIRVHSSEDAATITGLQPSAIRDAADLIGRHSPPLFVHGLGLSELTQGTASVITLAAIAMLTGAIGRPGAGVLPLRGQNNVQGNADMGCMPDLFTGYQRLDDPTAVERLSALWGTRPATQPGLTVCEMHGAAASGAIRGLWVQGEDIAQSDPDQRRVLEGLRRLDLLIVQELFMTETARHAHLVLPACSVLENEGTFTNAERRIQLVRPALGPPGEARPDWQPIVEVARRLGANWPYSEPAEVLEEIARIAPHLFGGVSHARLAGDGLQWPCPTPDHPGTASVHAEGFVRGKGRLVCVEFVPSPEHNQPAYPFMLITGRVLDHYNVGTMTRRTPHASLTPHDALEIHPSDADRLRIGGGQRVWIESRWGQTQASARRSTRISPGELFLSFHFPETRTNALVGPHLDPQSKCPQYKLVAVRLTPI